MNKFELGLSVFGNPTLITPWIHERALGISSVYLNWNRNIITYRILLLD